MSKLLKALKDIDVILEKNNKDEIIAKLKELRIFLENEIKLEDIEPSRAKQRIRKALNFSEKIRKGNRPVLSYCNYKDDFQEFSDSYFAVRLKNNDIIKELNDVKNTRLSYPEFDRIFNYYISTYNAEYIVNISDILKEIKVAKIDSYITLQGKINAYINTKNFENFITFMNFNKNDIITFKTKINNDDDFLKAPLYFAKENGTSGILMPCKKD